MEKGLKKGWMDAVRERCLSDETAPAPGSWDALGSRMRRAAARRRAAFAGAAGVAGVIAAVLFWAPWHERPIPSTPIAQISVPDSSSVVPGQIIEVVSSSLPETVALLPQSVIPDTPSPSFAGLTGESPSVILDDAPIAADATSVIPNASPVIPSEVERSPSEPLSPLLALDEPKPRHRARIVSVSLRAGSATVRRNAPISMMSAPYLAALNFLNTTDPSLMPRVKSNTSNTRGISAAANAFFPETSAGQYTHDLPLSLDISLRVDLTPKIGLETGLEYTYLHSTEEFVGSRLNQQLHFIGIPVRLDASLWTKGGFGLYAGVGAKAEKCVSATLGRVACEEPRLQWSAEAFGGVQYQLSSRTHLYFQPALSYYFTKTDLPTYRTEHPLGMTLHAGLRFDL